MGIDESKAKLFLAVCIIGDIKTTVTGEKEDFGGEFIFNCNDVIYVVKVAIVFSEANPSIGYVDGVIDSEGVGTGVEGMGVPGGIGMEVSDGSDKSSGCFAHMEGDFLGGYFDVIVNEDFVKFVECSGDGDGVVYVGEASYFFIGVEEVNPFVPFLSFIGGYVFDLVLKGDEIFVLGCGDEVLGGFGDVLTEFGTFGEEGWAMISYGEDEALGGPGGLIDCLNGFWVIGVNSFHFFIINSKYFY